MTEEELDALVLMKDAAFVAMHAQGEDPERQRMTPMGYYYPAWHDEARELQKLTVRVNVLRHGGFLT